MNKEFKWTVDLLAEFIRNYGDLDGNVSDLMDDFIKSKQPKPEWEIISYQHKRTKEIAPKEATGFAKAMYDAEHQIFQVIRLSDAEVFTIGDKFTANAGCELTINEFSLTGDDRIRVHSKEYGYWFLDDIKKMKKYFFTTKDGIKIYRDEMFYYVDKSYRIGEYCADECWTYGIDGIEFASKVAAEEYILMNKPLFSVNEIASKIINNSIYKDNYVILLVEKAKEKINKP